LSDGPVIACPRGSGYDRAGTDRKLGIVASHRSDWQLRGGRRTTARMRIPVLISALGLAVAVASPGVAREVKSSPKVVLELFTSQSCSACPPADALLKTIEDRPDIIALAYHVDYWDYLGWVDTFGSKANTDLQRDYASARSSNIYTPQLVVNGGKDVVGSHKDEVDGAIEEASLAVPITLKAGDSMLDVSIDGQAGQSESTVWLVTYIDSVAVTVERGENAGHKLDYNQVVTGRQILGMWDPETGAHLKLPLDQILTGPSNGAVILVQGEKNNLPGAIIGAALILP
jgi:hypothetical protein